MRGGILYARTSEKTTNQYGSAGSCSRRQTGTTLKRFLPGSKTGDFLSIFNVKPQGGINMLTYEEITKSEAIKTYIIRADESLGALGFTEHSFAHVMHVAGTAGYIFETIFNTIR